MKDFKYKVNGNDYAAHVEEQEDGNLTVTLNGKTFTVELPAKAAAVRPVIKPVHAPAAVVGPAPRVVQAAGPASVTSPLPGTIKEIKVKAGQKVKRGDVLVVMEAMKMANDILAENDGTVKNVPVKQGDTVNQGDVLVEMEADAVMAAPTAATPTAKPAHTPTPGERTVLSQLPGTITKILVKEGQRVKRGDVLLVMEAMKMANDVVSESDGIVKTILVKEESQVQSGEPLVEIA